jgi:TetR/AcrR family transcriptional regulator
MARSTPSQPAGADKILEASLPLFAATGFHGVSMRDVAAAVGVTPAALYYHFPDKEQLYQALIARVFSDQIPPLIAQMAGDGDPGVRLERLVRGLLAMLHAEPDLLRLGQWIMLDTDPARSRQLAENVFRPFFEAVTALAADLGGGFGFDPHRLCVSMLALVMFPAQSAGVMAHLPGFRRPADDLEALATHVVNLLRGGIGAGGTP